MKRSARVVCLSLLAILSAGVTTALAQTAADPMYSVEVSVGPTLGHKSSGFVAGEFDYRLNSKIDLFVEGGHMANVGTDALETNATVIANAINAQVGSTGITANHFDAGIRFHVTPPSPRIHPYVVVGVGFARTSTEVEFTRNGQAFDPSGEVFLGGDLSGTNTKAILVFGGGLMFPFSGRYFADFGYRFGGILSKVSDIENDITIKTQRIMLGAGVRF
jgi:opacity protein-like surface antigen